MPNSSDGIVIDYVFAQMLKAMINSLKVMLNSLANNDKSRSPKVVDVTLISLKAAVVMDIAIWLFYSIKTVKFARSSSQVISTARSFVLFGNITQNLIPTSASKDKVESFSLTRKFSAYSSLYSISTGTLSP